MASKFNHNEQTDADILQSKKDILRAHDIMPPYKKKTQQEAKTQETGEAIRSADAPETSVEKEETGGIRPTEEKPAGAVEAQRDKGEIPKFDLAEEIMAKQRKISAIRRKAPGKKFETQKAEPVGYTIGQPEPGHQSHHYSSQHTREQWQLQGHRQF